MHIRQQSPHIGGATSIKNHTHFALPLTSRDSASIGSSKGRSSDFVPPLAPSHPYWAVAHSQWKQWNLQLRDSRGFSPRSLFNRV